MIFDTRTEPDESRFRLAFTSVVVALIGLPMALAAWRMPQALGGDWSALTLAPTLQASPLAHLFTDSGISLELAQVMLLLPLGFLVALLLRHVVGLETLGHFLPVLLAAAARQTGLIWAFVGITAVALFAGLVRFALERMQLLRLPKMGALLTTVVLVLLGISTAGAQLGLLGLSKLSLFPIIILTFTVERLAQTVEEEGLGETVRLLVGTFVVIGVCYGVMMMPLLGAAVVIFPELLLTVLGLQLALGRYTGMRLAEILRFRRLLFARRVAS